LYCAPTSRLRCAPGRISAPGGYPKKTVPDFRNARRGSEAGCSLNRRSKSRRVQFIRSPDASDIENANHGSKVRYRYIERDNQAGNWELIEVRGS
jgi:hypothetical protein